MNDQSNMPVRRRNAPLGDRKYRITAKVLQAVRHMVWDGLKRDEAAKRAGLTDHALYVAFRKPHVRSFYLAELEVLRTSEYARNHHALVDVRDGTNQMARVAAVKTMMQIPDDPAARATASPVVPGVVIVLADRAAVMGRDGAIEAKPLIINEAGRDDE